MVESRMRVLLILGGLLLSLWVRAMEPPGAAPPGSAADPLRAVWREQHLDFAYAGRTARYSCDALSEKMRVMLLELGARRDLKISATGCKSQNPGLHLEFSSPALLDEALSEQHAGAFEGVEARFERFMLTSDVLRNFDSADCELVQEFTRQILPMLTTRGLEQDITCVPYQRSGSRYLVRGEILRTLPNAQAGAENGATAP